MKKFRKYLKIKLKLHGNLTEAIGMNWWNKAFNECNRITRVKNLWAGI